MVRRYTYCAMEQPERQIRGFTEEFGASERSTARFSTLSFSLEDSESPVVFNTVIPTLKTLKGQDNAFDVLVVHTDGRIRRLSSDLKTQRWNILHTEVEEGYEAQASFVVAFEDAQKTIFRRRPDLVASVLGDGHGVGAEASTILTVVMHPRHATTLLPSETVVHVFSIPAHDPTNDFAVKENQRLRHLMKIKLPDIPGQAPLEVQKIRWAANLSQAELSISFDRGYISYNISHYTPEVDSHMIVNNATFSSVLRISPRSVIAANQSVVSLYDAKYRSLQADLPMTEIPHLTPNRQLEAHPALQFITCFSKLGIVVAVCGINLLAFELATFHSPGENSRKRQRTGLLIDSIGKGIGMTENDAKRPALDRNAIQYMRPVGLTQKDIFEKWMEVKGELGAAAEAGDAAKFDLIMKTKFWKSLTPNSDEKFKGFPPAREYIDPDRISFLLSRIFSLTPENKPAAPQLTIHFLPFETMQWLVSSRHLSFANVQVALRSSNPDRVLPKISKDGLVRALARSGRSIKLLLLVLRGSVPLDAMELGHTLKILLDVARSHSTNSADAPKTLTESPQKQIPNAVKDSTQQSKQPRGAEAVLIDAVSGLNLSLLKLHSQPLEKVTHAIRSVLSNSDILSIIHHLRHSLATGGFTSRFTENSPPSFQNPKIPPLPLSTIVELLNACIDAVGPSGWISAAGFVSGESSEASLIADMRSEISAALAGVEEATYLKGILREFVRCCQTAEAANQVVKVKSKAAKKLLADGMRIKRRERVNGAEILVYDDVVDHSGLLNTDTKMLPLSLKLTSTGESGDVGEEPSTTKVLRSTGEVKTRSNREIGYLKGKATGKYSFERIIV